MNHAPSENRSILIQQALERMRREFSSGAWTPREKVALACRILSRHGHESGLAGQITAREPDGLFITQRFGCGLSEARASNLLRVDEHLESVDGAGMPNPANRFHLAVYRARADVRCIVHTHPPYVSALSMLGVPLAIAHMDTCALYENVAFLDRWPGVPVGHEEGALISSALGGKAAALLAHHGMVVAGRSVEEACVLALQFERAAFLQLTARGAGPLRAIDPALGREAREWLLSPGRIEATFAFHARLALAAHPECLT